MAKEKRLGRGLEALLNRVSSATQAADKTALPQSPDILTGTFGTPTAPADTDDAPVASAVSVQTKAKAEKAAEKTVEKESVPQTQEIQSIKTVRTEPADETRAEPETASDAALESDAQTETIYYLDINDIDANPYQPRQNFNPDEINQLADSLREHGLLQALVVRQNVDGRYELISGERRLRAALQAGWQQIPAMVIEATDWEMNVLSLVENLQRKDLNAIEKAVSFANCIKIRQCTQEDLSKSLSLDRSTVANLIRLLDLPDEVQQMVQLGDLSATHARALLPLGDEKLQRDFAHRIVREQLSSHEVEGMVRDFLDKEERSGRELLEPSPQKSAPSEKHIEELEKQFLMKTGMKVKLSQSTGGKGKITINFKNHEQFELLQNILMSADYPILEKGSRKKAA